jgi:hypothetical protein
MTQIKAGTFKGFVSLPDLLAWLESPSPNRDLEKLANPSLGRNPSAGIPLTEYPDVVNARKEFGSGTGNSSSATKPTGA